VTAAGVTITHPDKVLFPEDGITKSEIADYYARVAPVMLPHLRRRPITMERFPNGIGEDGFLQKNVVKGFPSWLKRVETPKKGGTVFYPLAGDARSLQWMANQNTVTIHVWPSRMPALNRPDLCVIDLDPSVDDAEALREAALACRDAADALGKRTAVKTSGSRGYHIVIPMPRGATFEDSSALAGQIAAAMIDRLPRNVTQAFSKAERGGRIYIDTGRNRAGATVAAAYTVRARKGAPVSAPCTWDEVASGAVLPQTFTIRNMAERLDSVGDLWRGLAPARPRTRR
jgi:bifunctional non-homologous end joining protein LigD